MASAIELTARHAGGFSYMPTASDAEEPLNREAAPNALQAHDDGHFHIKVPHFQLPRRCLVCSIVLLCLALAWTLATFIMQLRASVSLFGAFAPKLELPFGNS